MTRVALLAGLGPEVRNASYLEGTLLDRARGREVADEYLRGTTLDGFHLEALGFRHAGETYPLLRKDRRDLPHLTTWTVRSILERHGVDVDVLDTRELWSGVLLPPTESPDAILFSTTFVWDARHVAMALDWIAKHFEGVPTIMGGQYSNLKADEIMRTHTMVRAIVRGDAELALPALLKALAQPARWSRIPNLVYRERAQGRWQHTKIEYVDLDSEPAPLLIGSHPVVPYESMRGCPFQCKFCSFPHASPKWRYRSARKIVDDWTTYVREQGAEFIKAMDSTFTVPKQRFAELLELLPRVGVAWEGYSRANTIDSARVVDDLAASSCRYLSIGFESMSDASLHTMSKGVTSAQNRRAFDLLRKGDVGYRISFMAGYPGETPDEYAKTHDFLVNEYAGHFMLSVFGISDETMPLWNDRDALEIVIHDPENPDYSWSHKGMDVREARRLHRQTVDAVRHQNDEAVMILWQAEYQHRLLPHRGQAENLAVEKAVERIAFTPNDVSDPVQGAHRISVQLDRLRDVGVEVRDPDGMTGAPLWEPDRRSAI